MNPAALCRASALLSLVFLTSLPLPAAGVVSSDARFQIPATNDSLPGTGPMRRHDWFQRVWTEQRVAFAERAQREQGAIVFLGDSITQGWGDVASLFPGLKVANRGISGDTTRGVLFRLKDDVVSLKPRAVVLLIGTNDLEEYGSIDDAFSNVGLILKELRAAQPELPVVLCKVFPSSATKSRPKSRIDALNDGYVELVKNDRFTTVLDTWSLFADVHGDAKEAEFPDLLHPNGIGYAKWAAALKPILETLELSPAWKDEAAMEPGFVPLFNGVDLTGWHYDGQAALDGKTSTPDGRYLAKNGRVVLTVSRKGDGLRDLETVKTFPKDFVLRLEFRASPNADSGVFIRGVQAQCRDYLIAGPFTTLSSYRPLEWNALEITVKGGLAHVTCNGEVVLDAMPVPDTGSIGLESDRGQMEYRRLRIKE